MSNFRQYQYLDLDFRDGITGIVGRNGSGKSTILEAVLWCLFGNRAARTDKEGIKRQGAPAREPCRVELEFALGDSAYRLERSLVGRGNRSEARLSQEGELDAVTTREVDDYVIRLIGLNLKGFLSSFFARQKELSALSEARPADRKDHLARMLGIGRLDNAIQLLKEETKATRYRIEILGSLQIDPDAVGLEFEQKQSDISSLAEAKESISRVLRELEDTIATQAARVGSFREKEEEHNRLEKDRSSLTATCEAAEKELSRLSAELSEVVGIADRLVPLQRHIAGIPDLERRVADIRQAKLLEDERRRLGQELAGLTRTSMDRAEREREVGDRVRKLEAALNGRDRLIESMAEDETRIEKLREEYQQLAGALNVLDDRLTTLESQKAEIKELGPEASCRLCLRPFAGELDTIEKHFDEEAQSLRQQREPLAGRMVEVEKRGRAARADLEAKRKERDKLNRAEQDLASARAELKAVRDSLNDMRRRAAGIQTRIDEIGAVEYRPEELTEKETILKEKQKSRDEYIRMAERAGRRPEIEARLRQARRKLAEVEENLERNASLAAALEYSADLHQQARAQLEEFREKASETRLEIERSEGKIRLLEAEAGSLARRLDEFAQSKVEIGRLRETLTYLEKLSLLFGDFRVYLIGRIRPSLSRRTSQLFYEMTEGRYQEIELDEDYSLRVHDRGESFPITRFSGGEIDLANLCFRLAISIEMATTAGIDQSFIILDEIFGSQDAERQRMIFEGLGRLKSRFRQIIIISHIDDVKEMAENIVSVEVDRAGISRAVALEN